MSDIMSETNLAAPDSLTFEAGDISGIEHVDYGVEVDVSRVEMSAVGLELSMVQTALTNLVSNQPWRLRAECRTESPSKFVVDKGGSTQPAKEICARCVVREPCLEYAVNDPSLQGVWAGTSEKERRRIRTSRRRS